MSSQLIERMAVEVDGQGDALVMLHGLGGTSNTFWPQMSLLGTRFRVIRPDLPGSGRSPSSGPLSIHAFVDVIVRAARVLGIERAHFAGHSLGTIVCLHLAAQHPSLVRSLALFAPLVAPAESASATIRARAASVRGDGMQATADAILDASLSADTRTSHPVAAALVREMLMRQDAEGYARTCQAFADATPADLRQVACPTLLVTGDEDPIAPPATVRGIAGRIRGARVVVLSRCGHWPTVERPDQVNTSLRDFYFGRTMTAGPGPLRVRDAARSR
jgi:3-oxoadipate enol-lactonase